jgi:alginate O-acetyltransferase complex protein AlgI
MWRADAAGPGRLLESLMLFNSLEYLALFLPLVVLAFFALPHRYRSVLLFLASCYFYMRWKAAYILLIFYSCAVDWLVSLWLEKTSDPLRRKLLLAGSVVSNIGLLVYFKYTNFFFEAGSDIAGLFGVEYAAPAFQILLPVGISFYTFQSMSYTIDVYKGELEAEKSFWRFTAYVAFFPQLVAGPIVRASELLPQFAKKQRFEYDNLVYGSQRILWGLFKKVVVADRLALYVDTVYADVDRFEPITLVVAVYFFAFQVYCDFSGYSDIAIGSARIFGYRISENFVRPYVSKNIHEFWIRNHISMTSWFRDYLYIPMGGSRVGAARKYFNQVFVFFISGLWHGANWTFIVFGLLHGAYMIIGRLWERYTHAIWRRFPRMSAPFRVFMTFHLHILTLNYFRAGNIVDANRVTVAPWLDLSGIFALFASLSPRRIYDVLVSPVGMTKFDFAASILVIGVVVLFELAQEYKWFDDNLGRSRLARAVWWDAVALACVLFGVFGQQQFIYFQF